MSSKRVWTAVLALSAVLALGCGGDDDDGGGSAGASGSTAGSGAGVGGGGTGGTAGTTAGTGGGGTGGTGGTGGSGPMPVTCGTSMCTGSAFLQACCADAATNTCGLMNSTFGIACGKPGVADPSCPMQSISFMGVPGLTLTGCCTTDGMCGGFAMGSPCAVVPNLGDEDAGAPQTCTPPP